jgi:formamidopyrimidine-DNA glycosylase
MPELPEVETIARELRGAILGKRIKEIRLSGLSLRRPIPRELPRQLRGRTVKRIHRRGKYIIVDTDSRLFCLIHLGMSGRLLFYDRRRPRKIHTHATVRFTDESELHYRDPRRFGLLVSYEVSRLNQIPEIATLGQDPLRGTFNETYLYTRLNESRQELKSFLLNQGRIAGIGNIYACEALFHARLHPERRCHSVKRRESDRLVQSIRKVLKSAIRHRGTSISDFRGAHGRSGSHQMHLYVYQREGDECRSCGGLVIRLRQGNRSTFMCPTCQPAL